MSRLTRRAAIAGLAAATVLAALPAGALTDREASALIQQVVSDINRVINSGKPEATMYRDFERIFRRYGDLGAIAAGVLGPVRRQMSGAQFDAFANAFAGYMSRKYGARFREFIGGQIEVVAARPVNRYFEVETVTRLRGTAPFDVRFRVSDRSGRNLFFDIVIEGISLGKTERTEIGALLDRNRGDVNAMIEDLRRMG